jgi:hypothetical protein
LGKDQKLKDHYFDKLRSEVKKLENNKDNFYKLVNQKIQTIFENAYLEKLNKIYEKSVEA